MLTNIFKRIISVHEEIISHINTQKFDQVRPQLNLLISLQNELILTLRKTKFYKEFSNIFSFETEGNYENDELYEISNEDKSLSKEIYKNSKNLKNYIDSVIRNRKILDSNTKTIVSDSFIEEAGDNRFISDELETKLHEVCDEVSLSMDIGGTFVKILLNLPIKNSENYHLFKDVYTSYLHSIYISDRFSELFGSTYKVNVENQRDLEDVLEFLHSIFLSIKVRDRVLVFKYFPLSDFENGYNIEGRCLNFTGGGAYKYTEFLNSTFVKHNVKVNVMDEFSAIVEASKFLTKMDKSAVRYDLIHRIPEVVSLEPVYPFIISNIGSGTFYLKVESENENKHVFGTSISGGTSFGLVNYLLPLKERRSFTKIFKTGKYIYYDIILIKGQIVLIHSLIIKARTTIRMRKFKKEEIKTDCELYPGELYKSLIDMVAYNKGCLGYVIAKANGVKRIIYNGNFICKNTMDSIVAGFAFTSDVYRDKSIELCFPLHGPYIAALGSFIMKTESSS
ncbi:pantothenate kinase, putative [Theileria annulata]|uniref:Pantothenate kinase, putative n=1 Tax=Theileria annulata TaxID=5874 RepID=Q4U9L6_THEAN|nr:pantothenate kinase, putative [Theileria annulata]CAI76487.1 pantothenate kinase, putative [Theileria annulata]|eukprot:XP_953112.1 pantothenate kinase, putative [Theileria annulata]